MYGFAYVVDQGEEDPAAILARANKMHKKSKEGLATRKSSRKRPITSGSFSVILANLS